MMANWRRPMLEPPALATADLLAVVQAEYGLPVIGQCHPEARETRCQ